MRRMKQRLTAILLSICLLSGLMPGVGTVAYAQGTGAIRPGTDSIKTGDTVYFGKEQRAWQVLSTNGNGGTYKDENQTAVSENRALFLLAKDGMFQTAFDPRTPEDSNLSNDYSVSTLRNELKNRLNQYFSETEPNAILATTKAGEGCSLKGSYNDKGLDNDKLFSLSANELMNYMGYTGNPSTWTAGLAGKDWWLRSAVSDNTMQAGAVYPAGWPGSHIVDYGDEWARPAFNLNLDSVLFTSSAEVGKSSSAVGGEISEIQPYTGSEWKLTLKDNRRDGFSVGTTSAENNKLTVAYTGAITGTNEYISVMAADDSGAYTHYGRVAQLAAEEQSSGTVEIDLTDIDMTDKTLYIFNEQYNGDKMTDFTSELKEVSLTKNAYAVTNSLTNVSTDNDAAFGLLSGADYTANLSVSDAYILPESIKVIIGGKEMIAGTDYDYVDGTLTISAQKITGDIVITAEATAKTYGISVAPSSHDFEKRHIGYSEAPQTETFTISNTGNTAATGFTASLSGTNADAFMVSAVSETDKGTTFTVQPDAELSAGSYTADVVVSGSNNVSKTVTVSFTVSDHKAEKEWTQENGKHYHKCQSAGCTEHLDEAACSGGTPTYFKKAECTVCGGEYGSFAEDTTDPEGEIIIQENEWNDFWNKVTFGVFFKETQTVTIASSDDSEQVEGYEADKHAVKVQYYYGTERLTLDGVKALSASDWKTYDDSFNINPNNKYVVYAKITDHKGNATYISTDDLILDAVNPGISGIENNGTYCINVQFTITGEDYECTVMDGTQELTANENGVYTLGAGSHTITVTDKAGNKSRTYTVTVNSSHTPNEDDDNCETPILCKICQVETTAANTHDFAGAWQTDEAGHWHKCQNANCTVTDTKEAHSGGEATCKDAAVCEFCKKPYGKPNGHDYVYQKGTPATHEADGVKEHYTCKNCDTLFDKDKQETTKENLVLPTLAPEYPPVIGNTGGGSADVDNQNPQTGDTSNLWLWFALIFVSGGGIITTIVYGKKKKQSMK